MTMRRAIVPFLAALVGAVAGIAGSNAVAGGSITSPRPVFVESSVVKLRPGDYNFAVVHCPAGTNVVSGGWASVGRLSQDDVSILNDDEAKHQGWIVGAFDHSYSGNGYSFQAVALCI